MAEDPLTQVVREQVALGRLLPLGGPEDALWITESAVVRVLRRTCAALPGVRLGAVAVDVHVGSDADPDAGSDAGPDAAPDAEGAAVVAPGAGAPRGALPHGPVRIGADFEAAADEPLPVAAERLRHALWETAGELLGWTVTAVDLRVTGLLDDAAPRLPAEDPGPPGVLPGPSRELEVAALAVPGVVGLTARLAGFGPGLRVRDTTGPGVPPGREVQIQFAVAPGLVPVRVARQVLGAVAAAAAPDAPGPVTAAVVVTDA